MEIMKDILWKKEISAILTIHDLNPASRYIDRIFMMNGGRILAAKDFALVSTICAM